MSAITAIDNATTTLEVKHAFFSSNIEDVQEFWNSMEQLSLPLNLLKESAKEFVQNGTVLSTTPKILRYCEGVVREKAYIAIDFKTELNRRLFPKNNMVYGELIAVEYYAESDGTTYTDLIVKETFAYTRDGNGFALYRDQEITWYEESGTALAETKVLRKFYTPEASAAESARKRRNVIDHITLATLSFMQSTITGQTSAQILETGRAYIDSLSTEIYSYIEHDTSALQTNITNDVTTTWLDNVISINPTVTIRDYVLDQLINS